MFNCAFCPAHGPNMLPLHGERMTEFSFPGEPILYYIEHDLLATFK